MHTCKCTYVYIYAYVCVCVWGVTTLSKFYVFLGNNGLYMHSSVVCSLWENRIISNKWLWVSQQKCSLFYPTYWEKSCRRTWLKPVGWTELLIWNLGTRQTSHPATAALHIPRSTASGEAEEPSPDSNWFPSRWKGWTKHAAFSQIFQSDHSLHLLRNDFSKGVDFRSGAKCYPLLRAMIY